MFFANLKDIVAMEKITYLFYLYHCARFENMLNCAPPA